MQVCNVREKVTYTDVSTGKRNQNVPCNRTNKWRLMKKAFIHTVAVLWLIFEAIYNFLFLMTINGALPFELFYL